MSYTTEPLPYPAVDNSFHALSLDQVLADIPVAHKNVLNGPSLSDLANARLYWSLRNVQAGLLYAAHDKGATQEQVHAALGL